MNLGQIVPKKVDFVGWLDQEIHFFLDRTVELGGSGYWRVVGEVEELIDKAKEISQRTLFGIGFARILKKN